MGRLITVFGSRRSRRPRVRKFIAEGASAGRGPGSARRLLPIAGIFTLLLLAAGGGLFAFYYSHYADIVDRRVQNGFWHSRAGIYAAPYTLAVGRRASQETVIDNLRRAGYVETGSHDQAWNGSYQIAGDRILISTTDISTGRKQDIEVAFDGNRIKQILKDGERAEQFALEPELLTGRTETKRLGQRALTYDDIPENLRNAIIVAEDQRFFSHYGVDPWGIARAMLRNLQEQDVRQGGSTITQQLVKNTFLSPERSLRRKFAEFFLALALERRMTKEEILALYCNEIYLGQYGSAGIHGVEQAANAYFGKELKDISLAEAAAIAAMIKNPNRYAPHKNGDAARERRNYIVSKLGETGLADGGEIAAAHDKPLELAPARKSAHAIAPYFVDAASKEIGSKFKGDYLNSNFNFRVYTTIDTQIQSMAEQAVARRLAELDKVYAKKDVKLQASLVAIDPHNGHVIAMVGGRDYLASQFNRATEARRQPGSAFKPFVYAAALESGYSPVSTSDDSPTEFVLAGAKPYKPENYGGSYTGKNVTLKTALARSSNVVAVGLGLRIGLHRVTAKAAGFGFSNVEAYPSISLGTIETTPLELAGAYAALANGGKRIEPTFIDKIISAEESTIFLSVPEEHEVIRPQTAYMITDMLSAAVARGTAVKAKGALGDETVFVGKTGSSNDGWFAGYTPNLVAVAWVGTDENEDLTATGADLALPMWVDFMKAVVQSRPEYGGEKFRMPAGVTTATVDPTTGMLATPHCPLSETAAVSVNSISNVDCFVHQPRQEVLLATVVMEEPEEVEVTTTQQTMGPERLDLPEIEYDRPPPPRLETRHTNSRETEKQRKKEKDKVNETHLEEYIRQLERGRFDGW